MLCSIEKKGRMAKGNGEIVRWWDSWIVKEFRKLNWQNFPSLYNQSCRQIARYINKENAMKKSLICIAFIGAMSFAFAGGKTVEMPTVAKPLKVGELCVWQVGGKWQQAQCMPGIQTISAKGNVTAMPSDGGYAIYIHVGKSPTQDMKQAFRIGDQDKSILEQSGVAVAKGPLELWPSDEFSRWRTMCPPFF